MSLIHLKHPIHGKKIASLEAEAAFDEKHGWVRSKSLREISIAEQRQIYALEASRKHISKVALKGK
jgi:hypothetical protein